MSLLRSDGYVGRDVVVRSKMGRGVPRNYRCEYLVKARTSPVYRDPAPGYVDLGRLSFPSSFVGKKVRFKVEVLD